MHCIVYNTLYCSETTLTGESRFHISPPRGFEPTSLVMGSKWVVHWTGGTWWEWSEIAGSPQGSPPAADSVFVKLEGGPAASVKPGQKSSMRSSGIITLSAWGPSDGSGRSPPQTSHRNDQSRWGHQCSETTLTGESQFHISPRQGFWIQVPCDGKQTGSPLDQWDMVRMKWDCRLSTIP